MNLKNRKYYIYKKIINFFYQENQNIFLFVHVNNISNLEAKIVSSYCVSNKIENLNVKATLYKKIFKNKIFLNILSGPTRIFCFGEFFSFISFFKNLHVKKNFIPLLVFWNNNFYNYKYFYDYISFFLFKRVIISNYLKYTWFFKFIKKSYISNFLTFLNNKIFVKRNIINYIYGQSVLSFYNNLLITNHYENKIFKKVLSVSFFFKSSSKLNINVNILTYLNEELFKLSKQIVNLEDITLTTASKNIVKPLINIADVNYYENNIYIK